MSEPECDNCGRDFDDGDLKSGACVCGCAIPREVYDYYQAEVAAPSVDSICAIHGQGVARTAQNECVECKREVAIRQAAEEIVKAWLWHTPEPDQQRARASIEQTISRRLAGTEGEE